MHIETGTRLGVLEVTGPIGSGGMGEVYRARDTQLGRDVAVKIVRQVQRPSAELVARLRREAQLLASLSHPNIATLYGADEADGVGYLVMEFVPGETLAEMLQKGPPDVAEALRIASQIAAALESAHGHDIIHRDLKPSNIKVTPAGDVKVLDFGLAKLLAEASPDASASTDPTLTSARTRDGAILGTPAYMSPEQARGKSADRRTDVWAFGCVLFELLSGRPAFGRETISDTVAAVLEREPAWEALPDRTPESVRRLLRRCLEKDQRRRLRDLGDAALEIDDALRVPHAQEGTPPVRRLSLRALHAAGWVAAGAAAGALVTLALGRSPATSPGVPAAFVLELPPPLRLAGLDFPAVALSSSGSHIAYVASRGGSSQIFVRALRALESRPLAGTTGGLSPFFSPNGQWIAFFASGKLRKVPVDGGVPVDLCDAPIGFGGSWSRDDVIVFAPNNGSPLWKVPAAGGRPERVTELDAAAGEFSHRWPEILPDGKTVLFAAGSLGSWDDAQIVAQSLANGERTILVKGGTHPRYLPGRLVFARGGTLMSLPLDPRSLRPTGDAVSVFPAVAQSFDGAAQYAIAPGWGAIAYMSGGEPAARRRLVWVDRQGRAEPLSAPPRAYSTPRLSPDGRALAVTIDQEKADIWLYDFTQDALTQLTFDGANTAPLWAPDGQRVVFASTRAGPANLFWKLVDGSGSEERLTRVPRAQTPHSWSSDGRLLMYVEQDPSTGRDVWLLSADDRTARALVRSPAHETGAAVSPDGRWLAYVSDESAQNEVLVTAFPRVTAGTRVSVDGGVEPVWSRDGRELFYRSGTQMMAARVLPASTTFRAGRPVAIFEGPFQRGTASLANFDVARDGSRFIMIRPGDADSSARELTVVLHWTAEPARGPK